MRLNELQVQHFRNYEAAHLTFKKNLIIFLGENAQGKTNLLESIFYVIIYIVNRGINYE